MLGMRNTDLIPETKSGIIPFDKIMHQYKQGTLHSRSSDGPKVTGRKQAVAIALSYKKRQPKHGFKSLG